MVVNIVQLQATVLILVCGLTTLIVTVEPIFPIRELATWASATDDERILRSKRSSPYNPERVNI